MADPLGIAGTAAGLVSLGLQLYGEISKYIKAVKGREEDLRAARQNAEILRKCLNAIKGATVSTNTAQTASKDAVDECVASCKDELKRLQNLLARLRGPTTPADTLSGKARKKGRQLLYPFHKDSIVDLEKRLTSTNDVLQTALHAWGINVSITIQGAVIDLQSDTTAIKLSSENNSKQLSEVSSVVENIRESSHLIPEIHAQTAATSLSMIRQTEALVQSNQISIRVEENTEMIRQQVDSRMGRFEELLTQLVAANSAGTQSTQKQFGQLLARPSDLQTLCDSFLSSNSAQSPSPNLIDTRVISQTQEMSKRYRRCPCMRRRYTQRHSRSFGPFVFNTETCEIKHHAPGCPLSQLTPPEKQAKRWLRVSVPGVQSFLKKALHLSFSLSTGAGGSAFSQSMSLVAIVDPGTSPAFRLAQIAVEAVGSSLLSDRELQTILESCLRRIFWCYSQRVASPTDVNEDGITVLGKIVYELRFSQDMNIALFIQSLVALRLAVNGRVSSSRDEPIYACIARSRWLHSRPDTAQMLLDALRGSCDPEEGYLEGYSTRELVFDTFRLFQTLPAFAKVLQFAPLMLGILEQNLEAVRHLLNTYPLSIFETNYCGQTPVHIAVLSGNALILKLLLPFSNEKLLNTMDSYGYCPLDYVTLRQLHKACHTRRASNCEGCMMLEALLNAGSGLYPHALQLGLGGDDDVTQNLSFAVRGILLRHLKERRMRLQDLAEHQLPKEQRRSLTSPASCVLDRNATQVQKLLEDQSSHVPLYLKVCNEYEDPELWGSSATVYAYICDQTTAKLAWRLGFRDIGTDSMDGLYQALRGVLTSKKLHEQAVQTFSGYISWLVDRGLDLQLPIPATLLPEKLQQRSDLRTSGAHYFMRILGRNGVLRDRTVFTLPKKLSEVVLSQFAVDSCLCRCSQSGCNPLMKYLDNFRYNNSRVERRWLSSLPLVCKTALRLITRSERKGSSYAWIYKAILRRITFDALSLQHSCCNLHFYYQSLDPEEVAEVRAEEEDRLLLFENLCVEFEAKCGGNSKLVQFVRDTWHPRMIYELKQLDRQEMEKRLTVEERLAAEEIGVNWNSDISESAISEDEDDETSAYWMRMLDDISSEPDVQLPYGFEFS